MLILSFELDCVQLGKTQNWIIFRKNAYQSVQITFVCAVI